MISLLVVSAASIWWDYNSSELSSKIANSVEHPVFILFYTPWCHRCAHLPKEVRDFSAQESSVIFTTIDCTNADDCRYFNVTSIPNTLLIRGDNPKYWPRLAHRDQTWQSFYEDEAGPAVKIVKSNQELGPYLMRSIDGQTVFHLTTPNTSTALIEEYKRDAEKLRVWGCKFTMKLKPGSVTSLRAYYSPNCIRKIKGNISNLYSFMEHRTFSSFHRYDYSEYAARNTSEPFAMLLFDGVLPEPHYNAIYKLSGLRCQTIRFGWANGNDEWVMREFGIPVEQLPVLVGTNSDVNCTLVWTKRIATANKRGFLEHLERTTRGGACHPFIEGRFIKRSSERLIAPLLSIAITMSACFFLYQLRSLLNTKHD